ncbi:ArsR family transcriptional regulator [Ruminococcus sp. AM45-9BH]|nr:ArsR family transcriptional regulator [Ruminococcus sp. AM45-9BH]RHS68498.1 ArsR family transcriptional regulator [Ruminococcus sp. AM45-2]
MRLLFKVLSNRIRKNILLLLEEESLCAGDIIKHFDLTGATISYHLKVLTKSKILVRKKQGLTVYYSLNQPEWEYIKNWFKCG